MAQRLPEIQFPTVNFQTIRTALWRGDAAADAQPPLLFFNGIGGNLEMVQPLADKLAGSRHLVAFDVPGTGESEEPKYPYRPWIMARTASQLMKYWGFDGEHDVFGVSWGGGLAQQYAFQYRRRVSKVILAATSAGMIMVPGNVSAMTKMADNRRYVDPDFLLRNYETMYGDKDPSAIAGHALRIIPPTPRGYMFQLMAMMGWTSVPFLPLIRQPTLVMAGDSDNLVPVINGRFLTTLIPNAELDVIEGGGHLFMLSEVDRVMQSLTTFLNEGRDVAPAGPPPIKGSLKAVGPKKTPPKKTGPKKAGAKAASAKKAPVKKAPARKAPVKKSPTSKAA